MAAGDPTGADLASVTVNITDLPQSPSITRTTFTWDVPLALGSNSDYAIVVGTDGVVVGDLIQWGQDTGAGYGQGQGYLSSDSGSSWAAVPTRDRAFAINSAAGERDHYDLVNAYQADYDPFFIGQTFNASASTYTTVSIELPLRKTTTSPTGTVTISLRAVEGGEYPPGKATTPGPTDDQEDLEITGKDNLKQLTWVTPDGETPDFLIYFRAQGGAWVLQETITDDSTSHTLSSNILDAFSYYSIYEWRVDTRNDAGTTTGDTWTFITIPSPYFTDYSRKSDYDADKVWQPGTGWVDPNTFEFAGGGSYKERVVVVGHNVIYFGDL